MTRVFPQTRSESRSGANPLTDAEEVSHLKLLPAGPLWAVAARIDGRGPFPFLIDTSFDGAVVFDRAAASRGGFLTTSVGASSSVRVSRLEFTTRAGDRLIVPVPRGAAPSVDILAGSDPAGAGFAGVLGARAFGDATLYIRPSLGTMTVIRGKHRPFSEIPGATTLPLTPGGGVAGTWNYGRGTAPLSLDSGLLRSRLSASIIAALKPRDTITVRLAARIDDAYLGRAASRLPQLSIGNLTLTDVSVLNTSVNEAPAIGLDWLNQLYVAIDTRRSELVLERSPGASTSPLVMGVSRFVLARQYDRLIVASVVEPLTRYYRSAVNAEVLSVDSQAIAPLPLAAAQYVLDGFILQPATVRLRTTRGAENELRISRDNPFLTDRLYML